MTATSTDARLRSLKRAAASGDLDARMRCWEEAYRFGAYGPGFMVWTAGASEVDKMAPYVTALRLAAFLGEPSAVALYEGLGGFHKEVKPPVDGASLWATAVLWSIVAFGLERWTSEWLGEARVVLNAELYTGRVERVEQIRALLFAREDAMKAFPAFSGNPANDFGPLCPNDEEAATRDVSLDAKLEVVALFADRGTTRFAWNSLRSQAFVELAPAWSYAVRHDAQRLGRRQVTHRERLTERSAKTQAEKALKAFTLARLLPVLSAGWLDAIPAS